MDKKRRTLLFVIMAMVVAAVALTVTGCSKNSGKSFQLTEKETRPVLDPAMFSGQVRAAYAVAKRYPDIMNEVYCYCYCDQPPFRHKSLLSCFTEKHGAG